MFRETDTNPQMSLFDNPADLMGKRAVKKYEDPKAWFNQFHEMVTSPIDETIFKPLFKEGNMGAPTPSILQLVGMSIPQEEKNKRNNVEASIFQLCFHTRNNKTRYRGKCKHELWAFARSAWINLRRIILFQSKNAPDDATGAPNGPLAALTALLKTIPQTCVHLKLYFTSLGFRPTWVAVELKY